MRCWKDDFPEHLCAKAVGGVDSNENGKLDVEEVTSVFEQPINTVDSVDYFVAVNILRSGSSVLDPFLYTSDNILAFLTDGAPAEALVASVTAPLSSTNGSLTDPVGAQWNSACNTQTRIHEFDNGTSISNDVETSIGLMTKVRESLLASSQVNVITNLLNTAPTGQSEVSYQYLDTLDVAFNLTDPDAFVSLGSVTFNLTIDIDVNVSTRKPIRIKYTGTAIDLQDYNYNDGNIVALAAEVQGGYSTLGSGGRVIFNQVVIDHDVPESQIVDDPLTMGSDPFFGSIVYP